tara:strand:+ start:3417 stop:3596 length:180 start_codon:yes stop_codon:yes gene_type:complete
MGNFLRWEIDIDTQFLKWRKTMTNGGSKGPEEEKKEKPTQSPSTTEVGGASKKVGSEES